MASNWLCINGRAPGRNAGGPADSSQGCGMHRGASAPRHGAPVRARSRGISTLIALLLAALMTIFVPSAPAQARSIVNHAQLITKELAPLDTQVTVTLGSLTPAKME